MQDKTNNKNNHDDDAGQAAIEEKVRIMLDPEVEEPPKNDLDKAPKSSDKEVRSESPDLSEEEFDTKEEIDQNEITDIGTDAAVDDIIQKEGDKILESEDNKLAEAFSPDKHQSIWQKCKNFIVEWWKDPKKRKYTLFGVLIIAAACLIIPSSRYFVLNTAGVRSSLSVTIIDSSTNQPLKNAAVKLQNWESITDNKGVAKFSNLKLGRSLLIVEKRAFAPSERTITVGWGSNPIGEVSIVPSGSQYSFVITDYLSGKPVNEVEASSGEFDALSNSEGRLKLTVDKSVSEQKTLQVKIISEGYREEMVELNLDNSDETKVELVPDKSHIFITKRSGKYDVYKIDADGKNEEILLAGTGFERDDMALAVHPSKNLAALVSTRENVRNADKFLLSTLTLIDHESGKVSKISQSERIQIVGWSNKRLVYVRIVSGASAADPKRHRLMSYDFDSEQSSELASANYFNDVFALNSIIYFAPSSAYSTTPTNLYKINADGTNQQTVFTGEVWNTFRTGYDKLVLSTSEDWYEYSIIDNKSTKLSGQPAVLDAKIFVDGPDHKKSLWVDSRDGKGVLLVYDIESKSSKVVYEKSGLTNPVTWLNKSSLVFRVVTSSESADYVMSVEGGEPKKLRDVTNTSGLDRWYYY